MLNAGLFAAAVAAAVVSPTFIIWAAILGVALPFSIRRSWRWWRIRHPPASSWRASGADEA